MLIRALLIVLLVLNLGVALWWALGSAPAPAVPAELPPGVELLQLATASGSSIAAHPAPRSIAARIEQCASFGGFPDVSAAEAAGRRLLSGGLTVSGGDEPGGSPAAVVATAVRQAHAGTPRSWRVLLPSLPSAEETKAVAERIAATGFSDYYVIRDGADANAIALGLFRNEASASDRAATLVKAGFAAVVQPVGAGPLEHWLDIAASAPFDAERLRSQLDVQRTQPLECGQFSERVAAGPTDLGHNSAAR